MYDSWTVELDMDCSHQVPLSMGFPRQEHWSRLLFPPPGDFPNPGMEPGSPALQGFAAFQADSLPTESPGKSRDSVYILYN